MNAELMARALETPRYRATYCNATRAGAMGLAWESDTQDGCSICSPGWRAASRRGRVLSDRRHHRQAEPYRADDRVLERVEARHLRGRRPEGARQVPRSCEARRRRRRGAKFPDLVKFCGPVCSGIVKDFGGRSCSRERRRRDAGFFYDVTKPEDHGERIPGWDVLSSASVTARSSVRRSRSGTGTRCVPDRASGALPSTTRACSASGSGVGSVSTRATSTRWRSPGGDADLRAGAHVRRMAPLRRSRARHDA